MGNALDVARYLVSQGADLEYRVKSGYGSLTPLGMADDKRHIEMMTLLIKLGADPRKLYYKLVKLKDSRLYGVGKKHADIDPTLLPRIKVLEESRFLKGGTVTNMTNSPEHQTAGSPPAPTPGSSSSDIINQLKELNELKKHGAITDAEYVKLKKKIIGE